MKKGKISLRNRKGEKFMELKKMKDLIENIEKSGYEVLEFKEDTKIYEGCCIEGENVVLSIISLKITQSKNKISSYLYD